MASTKRISGNTVSSSSVNSSPSFNLGMPISNRADSGAAREGVSRGIKVVEVSYPRLLG